MDMGESAQAAGASVSRWWKGETVDKTVVAFNRERQDWTYEILLDRGGDHKKAKAQYVFRVYGKKRHNNNLSVVCDTLLSTSLQCVKMVVEKICF